MDYPLDTVLRRSIRDGPLLPTEPDHLYPSQSHDSSFPTPPLETTHRIGLFGTSFRPNVSSAPMATQPQYTATSSSSSFSASSATPARHVSSQGPRRGYYLPDFSSDEEDVEEEKDAHSDDEDSDAQAIAEDQQSEERLDWNTSFSLLKLDPRDPAFHVASLASRRGPWDVHDERKRALSKKHISDVVDKIYDEVKALQQPAGKPQAPTFIRDADRGQHLAKQGVQQANALKEQRALEIQKLNEAMAKDIESCLAILEEERQEAQRIRDEVIRKEREERERLVKEAEERKKAAEAKKKEEELKLAEKKKRQEEQAKEAAKKKAERAAQASANAESLNMSPASKDEYDMYWDIFFRFRNSIKPAIAANVPLRKQVNAIKRDITPAVGQLVNQRQSIVDCFNELLAAFNKAQQLGQEAYIWILYFAAKTFVIQSETEARIKVSQMYPYAHVIVLLVGRHPLFMDIMMARLTKKCPYVTPVYYLNETGMTDDEYKKRLAYVKKDGKWEDESEYNARQCAIFSLYCAILQTTPLQGTNPYSISHGWTWMARVLNMPPRPITPSLIDAFLEVCGPVFLATYRAQAQKMLSLLYEEFLPVVPKRGAPGKSRLQQMLQRYFERGHAFEESPDRFPH